VTRTSRIASIASKSARSGPLVFVTVVHEIANGAGVAVREEHDIVYRGLPAPGTPAASAAPAPSDETFARTIVPGDVLLFRDAVRALCAAFPDEYHREVDARRAYPEKFVDALTEAGWLAALIPTEYGGSGLGLAEATVIMEEINRSGGNAGACHGQMYNMGTLLRHGSDGQKQLYLPKIASGEWRVPSIGVA